MMVLDLGRSKPTRAQASTGSVIPADVVVILTGSLLEQHRINDLTKNLITVAKQLRLRSCRLRFETPVAAIYLFGVKPTPDTPPFSNLPTDDPTDSKSHIDRF